MTGPSNRGLLASLSGAGSGVLTSDTSFRLRGDDGVARRIAEGGLMSGPRFFNVFTASSGSHVLSSLTGFTSGDSGGGGGGGDS